MIGLKFGRYFEAEFRDFEFFMTHKRVHKKPSLFALCIFVIIKKTIHGTEI